MLITIAALFILGAAICATGQTNTQRKENSRETQPDPSSTFKQEPTTNPSKGSSETEKSPPSTLATKTETKSVQYSYEFNQTTFFISHVLIEHDWDGTGKITFVRKNEEPIIDPLDISKPTIERLRTLWEALHFLDSDRSYQTPKQYPHLGTVRLHMKQDTRDRVAEFNWTTDRDALALVNEYKRIANQAIFIFDITLARENQPLEAPKLMEQFETYVRRGDVSDPQQLVPLFRELSTDERIPLMARNTAIRILKKIEK